MDTDGRREIGREEKWLLSRLKTGLPWLGTRITVEESNADVEFREIWELQRR